MPSPNTREIIETGQDGDSLTDASRRGDLSGRLPNETSNSLEDRYSRQVLFTGIGVAGQRKLALAHIAIVGCGATGAAAASLLARAGVGVITLIDRDFVE